MMPWIPAPPIIGFFGKAGWRQTVGMPAPSESPLFRALEARLRTRCAAEGREGAHGVAHALRVARQAEAMAREEGADPAVCAFAGLLHDLVHVPKNHPDRSRAGERCAAEARAWCLDTPGLEPLAEAVACAVRTHSFSAGLPPESLEGAVLQDADRLEAIGAIGIARCFATGGDMGADLWDAEDPWAKTRPLDDRLHSLDHFPLKLLRLAEAMNTGAGRRRARARHATLEAFLEALRAELS